MLTPSGFSASTITSKDLLQNDTLHQGIVLDLSTKFEMSADPLDKTKVKCSISDNNQKTYWKNRGFKRTFYYFNEFTYASQGLTNLTLKLMDNKPLQRAKATVDDQIIAKVILLCR